MIDLSGSIFVYAMPVDMRKSIDGLGMLVNSEFTSEPMAYRAKGVPEVTNTKAPIFVFINRSHDKLKILMKEGNGFCLIYKRLDRGRFQINLATQGPLHLTQQQLRWLLDGLDYASLKPLQSPHYSVVF